MTRLSVCSKSYVLQGRGIKHKQGGYLTVFLSLCLPLILSLFLTVIEGAKINTVKMKLEIASEISLHAVLSEFQREMFEKYDLFFIDSSYGEGAPGKELPEKHLRKYLEGNLSDGIKLFFQKEMAGIHLEESHITGIRYIGDDGCAPLRQQIYAYMTAEPVEKFLAEKINEIGIFRRIQSQETEWTERSRENRKELEGIVLPESEDENGVMKEMKLENPADRIHEYSFRPALFQVIGETREISEARINISEVFSGRNILQGECVRDPSDHHYPQAQTVLMDEYILEKCSHYGDGKDSKALSYQVEYILFGKERDRDNLEAAARRLLLLRSGIDCVSLFADPDKMSQVKALAAGISAVVLMPWLEPVLCASIALGWAYMEALEDVRSLFQGEKVPLLKLRENWKTGISSIFMPDLHGESAEGRSEGLDYSGYLRMFLFLEEPVRKSRRLLDVMETDIQAMSGNSSFRIDGCADTLEVMVKGADSKGRSYRYSRTITYN